MRAVAVYVFITTTTVCVSELNVLLVYPACSKLKYDVSEDADCRASARSLFLGAHTPLSLCVCSVPRAAERSCAFSFQLKQTCRFSNLHARIAEITAQLLSLSNV